MRLKRLRLLWGRSLSAQAQKQIDDPVDIGKHSACSRPASLVDHILYRQPTQHISFLSFRTSSLSILPTFMVAVGLGLSIRTPGFGLGAFCLVFHPAFGYSD